MLTITLESTPKNATHWSTRSLAAACGLSRSSVHRVWQAFALAPHRSRDFQAFPGPAVYRQGAGTLSGFTWTRPIKLWCCVSDEKSQIQALDRSQPILPMRPGQAERRAHDYKRNGTTSLFAALDTKSGKVIGQASSSSSSVGVSQVPGYDRRNRAAGL